NIKTSFVMTPPFSLSPAWAAGGHGALGRSPCDLDQGVSSMTDRDALLAAVIAEPDDDGARLVYADFLEERGDTARAQFLRTQVALAKMPADDPRHIGLYAKYRQLLDEHGEAWADDVFGRQGVREVTFTRGFVGVLHVTAHAFFTRGGAWAVRTP